jgi:tRNA/tmRNA/rRNA uracil-C5-methylase (TrmA/RlmC/RlmD family)
MSCAATDNHYRNKSQIPVGKNNENKVITGFYRQRSHDIINMDDVEINSQLVLFSYLTALDMSCAATDNHHIYNNIYFMTRLVWKILGTTEINHKFQWVKTMRIKL